MSKTKILPINYILFSPSWNRPTTFLYEKKIIPFTISTNTNRERRTRPTTLGHEPMRYLFLHLLTIEGNETRLTRLLPLAFEATRLPIPPCLLLSFFFSIKKLIFIFFHEPKTTFFNT